MIGGGRAASIRPPRQAFSPGDLSGLATWLKADGSVFQDVSLPIAAGNGDPAARLLDHSGNGRDAFQATTAAQPTLITGLRAGLPGVRFDGSADFLRQVAFTAIPQPYTVCMVWTHRAGPGLFALSGNGPIAPSLYYDTGNAVGHHYAGADLASAIPAVTTATRIVTFLANGASSRVWEGLTSVASGNAGTDAMTGVTIGANWVSTQQGDIDFFELLVYSGDKSASLAQLFAYLNRWEVY